MTGEPVTVDPSAPLELCASSIMPGQHCSRPVAAGETLCENHLAMGAPA